MLSHLPVSEKKAGYEATCSYFTIKLPASFFLEKGSKKKAGWRLRRRLQHATADRLTRGYHGNQLAFIKVSSSFANKLLFSSTLQDPLAENHFLIAVIEPLQPTPFSAGIDPAASDDLIPVQEPNQPQDAIQVMQYNVTHIPTCQFYNWDAMGCWDFNIVTAPLKWYNYVKQLAMVFNSLHVGGQINGP